MHEVKFVHRLNILRDISLRWGVVCPLLDKRNTYFFHRSSFPGDYFLVCASDENNVVVFIRPSLDILDTPQAEISDEEVVDTMGDDMLEAMELKNCKIYDYYDSSCGEEYEIYYYT